MKKIRNLILLAVLLVQATPCLAQTIPVFYAGTADNMQSILQGWGNGTQSIKLFFDFAKAQQASIALAQQNAAAGMTGASTQAIVLEGIMTDGASVGRFFVMPSQLSNLPMGVIGGDVNLPGVQNALNQFNAYEVIATEADFTHSYLIANPSASQYTGFINQYARDPSINITAEEILGEASDAFKLINKSASNMFGFQGSPLSPGTKIAIEAAGGGALSSCVWFCGVQQVVAVSWAKLKIGFDGLTNEASDLLTGGPAGLGGVGGMAAVYGGIKICDALIESLCSTNINLSLSNFMFSSDSGPTLVNQTINPYNGSIQRDYSDRSSTWNWSNGAVTRVDGSGQVTIQDPVTGEIGIATPVDGQDARLSQIFQVNFPDQTVYWTQAGYSQTLGDAQAAVAATNALNSVSYQYPALFQIPAVMPILDQSGTPAPVQQSSDGTVTTTGTTPSGNQYTKTVQKDSSGNVVSEVTTIIGDNFTTSRNDLTGTSQTIQRNPDGSTTIFNCIQGGVICASDAGIVNYNDGWNGNNPYAASNQSVPTPMPGGGIIPVEGGVFIGGFFLQGFDDTLR